MATRKPVRKFVNAPEVFEPRHFTHAVSVSGGKLVFLSGQVSYDVEGKVVGKGDFRAQCERVMECIGHNLAAAGAGFHDVIKVNAYVVRSSPAAIRTFREVRERFLNPEQLPASTLVGVESLAHEDLMIEVEVVACVQDRPVVRKAKSAARRARPGARAVHGSKKRVRT